MIVLVRAEVDGREALWEQLSDYLVEFAVMEGAVETLDQGSPTYPWFDHYWTEPDRLPFFIEAAGAVVGFCLIRAMNRGWNVAEFGIRPASRRKGLGRESVRALARAAKTAGADYLRADVHDWNHDALKFWKACGFVRTNKTGGLVSTRLSLDPAAQGCIPSQTR